MDHLLMPKFNELNSQSKFWGKYKIRQNNNMLENIKKYMTVVINKGADKYVQENFKNAHWYSSYKTTISQGGVDGRIGIVTDYHDQESVDSMKKLYKNNTTEKPWVRVTSFLNERGNTKDSVKSQISHEGSVVIDARLCTVIPMSFYNEAREYALRQHSKQYLAIKSEYDWLNT
jgi:hypothetical protein